MLAAIRSVSILRRFAVISSPSSVSSCNQRSLRGRATDIASSIEKCSTDGDVPNISVQPSSTTTPMPPPPDPYEPEKPQCLFCRYQVRLDHRNVRLLSQYISSFTGRLYEQNVTGLCEPQYRRLREAIVLSRKAGFMPVLSKQPRYLKDPKLFDPMKPIRPNPF